MIKKNMNYFKRKGTKRNIDALPTIKDLSVILWTAVWGSSNDHNSTSSIGFFIRKKFILPVLFGTSKFGVI